MIYKSIFFSLICTFYASPAVVSPRTKKKEPLPSLAKNHQEMTALENCIRGHGDINGYNHNGYTPLIRAILEGNLPGIALLLQHGALTTIADTAGNTPFHSAVKRPTKVTLETLLYHQAAPAINSFNKDGSTALLLAARAENFGQTELLLHYGADHTLADKQGKTVLDCGNRAAQNVLRQQCNTVLKREIKAIVTDGLFNESGLHQIMYDYLAIEPIATKE